MQFEYIFNSLKKKSYRIEQLEMVIDSLIAAKIKSDTIFFLLEFQ